MTVVKKCKAMPHGCDNQGIKIFLSSRKEERNHIYLRVDGRILLK